MQVGLQNAKKLSQKLKVPLIPVNHLEAHLLTSRFSQVKEQLSKDDEKEREFPLLKFPYISLLATGKHTQIVLSKGVGHHVIYGTTLDIAVG